MRSLFVKLASLTVCALFVLAGAFAYATANQACVMFHEQCYGYDCLKVGTATCTQVGGLQVNWNRLTQNGGAGYVLGVCQAGTGNCNMTDWHCDADKYFNANPNDQICTPATLQCTDPATINGCKSS